MGFMNGSYFDIAIPTKTNISNKLKYLFELKGDNERLLVFCLNEINSVDKNNTYYPVLLKNIGFSYSELGDYFNAEKYYIDAINIAKNMGMQDTEYAGYLWTIGSFYSIIGDYEKAAEYFINVKNIYETNKTLDSNVGVFTSIASVYYRQKKIKEIQEIYNEAEPYLLKRYANDKYWRRGNLDNYSYSLLNLGHMSFYINDNKKAEDYYLELKEIQEKRAGKEHPNYASILSNLGNLYKNAGEYAKAEKNYSETIIIREKTVGKEHPYYTNTMNSLSLLYQNNNDFEKAKEIEQAVCSQTIEHINNNFSFLSEHQRNSYWATVEDIFVNSYSLSYHQPDISVNELNFNNTLFTKGILLRTNNQIRDAIYDSGDELLIQQFEQLGSLRKQINALNNADSLDVKGLQILSTRADSLDKTFTQASAKFRDLRTDMAMSWQDVQKQLNSNEAAIEFVHFRLYDKKWTDTTMYAALVLRAGMKTPAWIPLCEQKELQSALFTESKDSQIQTERLYSDRGKELYQLIWEKLEKELPKTKTIYYSPSGLFHKVAFNALPTGNGNVLLSDKYDLQLVSSTREIGRIKKDVTAIAIQDSTAVYGGLAYDNKLPVEVAAVTPTSQESTSEYSDRTKKYRRRDLPDADLRGSFSKWEYLKGTKAETEQIVKIMDNKRVPYQYYFETKGNEESFKNLSGRKADVIHLSTHGFFLPDIENEAVEEIVMQLGGSRTKPYENPLLRSGLIMSGANIQWLAKEKIVEDGVEDGILTADEISRLNLTKTKLVVLSACETGLGDVKNSEGVFGLQRAFKLAGVESLIMSLWKVPDQATSELMSAFYDEWLSGKTRHASFKSAQKKVRDKYHSPYYWAAFVMMD